MRRRKLLVALAAALSWTFPAWTAHAFADGESIDLVVAAGRPLRVALDERVRVKRVGQPVTATVVEPVYAYDRIVVPAGAKVLGRIETKTVAFHSAARFCAMMNASSCMRASR